LDQGIEEGKEEEEEGEAASAFLFLNLESILLAHINCTINCSLWYFYNAYLGLRQVHISLTVNFLISPPLLPLFYNYAAFIYTYN
jgi:hypothetical protein